MALREPYAADAPESLAQVTQRMTILIDRLNSVIDQGRANATRLDGGQPEDPAKASPTPVPNGVVSELMEHINTIDRQIDYLQQINARINNKL